MNIYSIYVKPQEKDNNFIIIKQGFSLPAAILNIGWALYHKMWSSVIIVLICSIVGFSLNCNYISMGLFLATILIFGFCNDEMREYNLERKSYQLQDIIVANSETEAELKFLARLDSAAFT